MLGDDGEPEPGAVPCTAPPPARAAGEAIEDAHPLLRRDAWPTILHRHPCPAVVGVGDDPGGSARVAVGVLEKVRHHSLEAQLVNHDPSFSHGGRDVDEDRMRSRRHRVFDEWPERHLLAVHVAEPGIEAGDLQEVVDETAEAPHLRTE